MPSNPDPCECGSRLFTAVWAIEYFDSDSTDPSDHEWNTEETEPPDAKKGTSVKRPIGFECKECGRLQLTREVPQRHADDDSLDLPDDADRDMVRED